MVILETILQSNGATDSAIHLELVSNLVPFNSSDPIVIIPIFIGCNIELIIMSSWIRFQQ